MKNSVVPDQKPAALNPHIFYLLKCHSQKEVLYRNVLEAFGHTV